MRKLRRSLPHQVSMGNIVAVLTIKRDPSGNPRAPEVLRKLRVAISDPSAADSVDVESYSCCVDPMSNIVVTALVPALEAEQTSIDVGGAYWHGTPPSIAEGGRVILAPVPAWLEGLGAGRYRARDKHGGATSFAYWATCPAGEMRGAYGRNASTRSSAAIGCAS